MMRHTKSNWRIGALLMLAVLVAAGCTTQPAPDAKLQAARAALQGGDAAKAITELEEFLKNQPNSAEGHALLAQAYEKTQRTDDAVAQYQAAIIMAPENVAQYILDSQDKAAYFLLGNAYVNSGLPIQAITQYEAVLKIDSKHIGANTNLGAAYYQMGDLERATQQLQAALALAPNDPETHYMLGAALVQQNQLTQAEAEFRKALAAQPDMAEAYIGLGNVLLLSNKIDEGIASLRQAIQVNPSLPEAYLPLGKALAFKGDKAGAREALDTFLKLNPPAERRQEAEQLLAQLGQ